MDIGLIGFGGVSKAFIELLFLKRHTLSHLNIKYIIKSNGGIYFRNGFNLEEFYNFLSLGNSLDAHPLWSDINIDTVINNCDIDLLVELTPTNIDNGEPGYSHIKKSLTNKINVVTGNKGPILLHYKELKYLASINNVHLKIGCTTGGALPSINVGTMGTLGSDILQIEGVLNGTTNFILEEMSDNNVSYEEALKKAQDLQIAESNPTLDVCGYDSCIKLLILTNSIYGTTLSLDDCDIEGITHLTKDDILHAKNNDKRVKLIAKAVVDKENIKVKVSPEYIDDTHTLYNVCGKNKGVTYKTDTLGDITIIGGASSPLNAAASILRDILSID